MKRKLSMLLSIILVATSFIGCDENSVAEQQEFITQEITPQEVVPQEVTPQAIPNPSTEGAWDSLSDYTVIIDEDGEYFTQEEFEYIESNWDSISDYDIVYEESETPEATSVPNSQAIDVVPNSQASQVVPNSQASQVVPNSQADFDQTESNITPVNAWHTYKDKNVIDLYSYDIENYTMARFDTTINVGGINSDDNASKVNSIVNALGEYNSTTPNKYAYFIETYDYKASTHHKDYVFIDESNQVLVDGIANLGTSSLYPSWLVHMSQSNIVSANISDALGMNVTLTNEGELGVLSSHLKLFLPVTSTDGVFNGNTLRIPTSNGSDFKKITINFNNDVYYDLQISGYTLQIYTSDLDKTVDYTIDSSTANKMMSVLLY